MDYTKIAEEILRCVGGKDNVSHLEHCSTRLRFSLIDDKKADPEALKKIKGVIGVVMTAQCQVVIGPGVTEVYQAVVPMLGPENAGQSSGKESGGERRRIGAVILDFIVGVFQPLIPAIAGGGILKSLLLLLVLFGWMDKGGSAYALFQAIGDAPFYFLPLLVAMSTAAKLKCNRFVAVSAVGTLLLPALMSLLGGDGGVRLFGIGVQNIAYAYQVFPALLCVLFLAPLEKWVTRITPKPIRIFFVPLVLLVITVPVTLLLLGPLGYNLGQAFTTVILWLFDKLGFVAVTLLAMALPFMIATGMHKALVPYAVSSITELGKEMLYLPASLAHNIAESGASFAAAVRTKDAERKSTAISAGVSALFGITEPALYGVTLQNKRVLASVLLGCGTGGLFVGLMRVESFVAVGPGIASLTAFISEDAPQNILFAVLGALIAFAVSFLSGMFLYREEEMSEAENVGAGERVLPRTETLYAPLGGEVIPLHDVKDETFAKGILGDGVAIRPDTGVLCAPADGVIDTVFDTRHAVSMRTEGGAEILMHIGMDTVALKGEHFEALVREGQRVKVGDGLIRFDADAIRAAGYDLTTPMVIGNADEYRLTPTGAGQIDSGAPLLELESTGSVDVPVRGVPGEA